MFHVVTIRSSFFKLADLNRALRAEGVDIQGATCYNRGIRTYVFVADSEAEAQKVVTAFEKLKGEVVRWENQVMHH